MPCKISNRVVNVVITPYSMKAVLNELAKAFAILPNLHTVQLNLSTGQGLIPGVFRNQHYPQIRTLSLTMPSLAFADYCPEARVIVPYLSHCFVAYPRNSPGLEVLGVTSLYRKNDRMFRFFGLQNVSTNIFFGDNSISFEESPRYQRSDQFTSIFCKGLKFLVHKYR